MKMLLIQEAPFSVKNPSVSSVASVRYLFFGADATEAEPVQKLPTGNTCSKEGWFSTMAKEPSRENFIGFLRNEQVHQSQSRDSRFEVD